MAAVLVDTGRPSVQQRRRNLKRNIRREGASYIFFRALSAVRRRLEEWADEVIPDSEVEDLLNTAFPDRSLVALARRHDFPAYKSGNLNALAAREYLRRANADPGIVLGTRILKRKLFSIPRMGCINLHNGRVPEYRGCRPDFGTLMTGRRRRGLRSTVWDGLDTGDVVGTSEVSIHPKETPDSLRKKLDLVGAELLVRVVQQIGGERISGRLNQRYMSLRALVRNVRR